MWNVLTITYVHFGLNLKNNITELKSKVHENYLYMYIFTSSRLFLTLKIIILIKKN